MDKKDPSTTCPLVSLDSQSPDSFISTSSSSSYLEDEELDLLLSDSSIPPLSPLINGSKSSPSISSLVSDCIPEKLVRVTRETNKAIRTYLEFHELPFHLQDNFYIISGYRAHYTFSQCFRSIFAIHNETGRLVFSFKIGNIWTHLIGALVFSIFLIIGYQNLPHHATTMDYVMITIFLVSAIKCLLCSTIFHTFSCHSHSSVYDVVAILDYSGISLLILGSFVIYLNYALYCHNTLRWVYIALVSVLCLSGVVLPWFSFFRSNEFRVYRTLFFVGSINISQHHHRYGNYSWSHFNTFGLSEWLDTLE